MHTVVELQGLRPEHRFRERTCRRTSQRRWFRIAIYSERAAACAVI
jgi:hypothetical protein